MEQNNNQQQFRCTGDCFRCQPLQRQYCAAQWSYNSLRMIERMQASIEAMSGTIKELSAKVDAIQGNEASLFDPTSETLTVEEVVSELPTDSAVSGAAQ